MKVGDRVIARINVGDKKLSKQKGKIIFDDGDKVNNFCVQFDKDIDGHQCNDRLPKDKRNHGWWLSENDLDLIGRRGLKANVKAESTGQGGFNTMLGDRVVVEGIIDGKVFDGVSGSSRGVIAKIAPKGNHPFCVKFDEPMGGHSCGSNRSPITIGVDSDVPGEHGWWIPKDKLRAETEADVKYHQKLLEEVQAKEKAGLDCKAITAGFESEFDEIKCRGDNDGVVVDIEHPVSYQTFFEKLRDNSNAIVESQGSLSGDCEGDDSTCNITGDLPIPETTAVDLMKRLYHENSCRIDEVHLHSYAPSGKSYWKRGYTGGERYLDYPREGKGITSVLHIHPRCETPREEINDMLKKLIRYSSKAWE